MSHRFPAFLALSLTLHGGMLLFAMQGYSRPLPRTQVLAVRLIEVSPPPASPASKHPPSPPQERITPPKLLARPKALPEVRQAEVSPSFLQRDVPAPVESPAPPSPVATSRIVSSHTDILPALLFQGMGRTAGPPDSAGGARFAVAALTAGRDRLTFPVGVGEATSATGIGDGSGSRGGRAKGSDFGVSQPTGGYQILPRYPESARRQGIQGTTELKIHILADGSVAGAVVARSAGHPDLDEAALDAVKNWRFEPARRGQEPVAVWALIPVRFRLD